MNKATLLSCLAFCLSIHPAAARAESARTESAQTGFAIGLYHALASTPGNLSFSPYGLGQVLEMAADGAKGATADELRAALQRDPEDRRGPVLPSANGLELETANALWGQQGFDFDTGFLAGVRKKFAAGFETVDFGQTEAARSRINGWAAKHTAGKITELISAGMLNSDARLVLANALYFKADWAAPFAHDATWPETFHPTATSERQVPMMHQTDHFDLARADGLSLIELPYIGGNDHLEMVVILPDRIDGLGAVEAALSPSALNSWLARGKLAKVYLALPKTTTSGSLDLVSALKALGIKAAFSSLDADFSGIAPISGRKRLSISAVVQRSYVAVDEQGTEAAAATAAVMMMVTAMPQQLPEEDPIPFVADHPFLYLIRDWASGEILFLGRMVDPTGT